MGINTKSEMLSGGHQLGLCSTNTSLPSLSSTTGSNAPNKTIALVKLTDAAIEAFNNYIKKREKYERAGKQIDQTTTVEFMPQSGTLRIPRLSKSEETQGDDEASSVQSFNFGISSALSECGPQGSFECISSTKPGAVASIGTIQAKIQLNASAESSFQGFGAKFLA